MSDEFNYNGIPVDKSIEVQHIKGLNYPILGYAPGMYLTTCANCDKEFLGDKYARQCLTCAINALNESHLNLIKENNRLKNNFKDLKRIKEVLNTINLDNDE